MKSNKSNVHDILYNNNLTFYIILDIKFILLVATLSLEIDHLDNCGFLTLYIYELSDWFDIFHILFFLFYNKKKA